MLKRKFGRKVVSDEGFEVEVRGRGHIVYKEEIKVASEMLGTKKPTMAIWKDSIKELNDEIDDKKAEQVINNIIRSLELLGIDYEF